MRLVSRSNQSSLENRREQARRKRASADTLGSAFPAVERVRVDLTFRDATEYPPVSQTHEMYPPAPAYFEFACPYGDCDGSFDLNRAAASLLAASTPKVDGTMQCSGSRTGAGLTRQPCGLQATYRIVANYEARARSTR